MTLRTDGFFHAQHASFFLGVEKGFCKDDGIEMTVQSRSGSGSVIKLVGNKNDDSDMRIVDVGKSSVGGRAGQASFEATKLQSKNSFCTAETILNSSSESMTKTAKLAKAVGTLND